MGGGIAGRVLSLTAALAAACSVLAPSDDELMGGGSGAPEAGTGSASGTGAEAGTGGSPAGGGTHAGGIGGALVGGAGGALGGAGSGGDSGAGGVPTGGTGGAPEGGAIPTVSCAGNGVCSPPGQYCCAAEWQKWQCVSASTACNGGTQIYCDGPEDCATGQVCCAAYAKISKTYQKLSCAPKDTCAPEQENRVVCGSSGKCPVGQSCTSSTLLPGYSVCSTPDAGAGGSGGAASGGTGGFGGFDASFGGMAGTSG